MHVPMSEATSGSYRPQLFNDNNAALYQMHVPMSEATSGSYRPFNYQSDSIIEIFSREIKAFFCFQHK
jgi:hypothetical protein